MTERRSRAQVLQGNEACAVGALAAGVNFFGGYPITPSSEIAEVMSQVLPLIGGRFIQMEDEIASIAAVVGAALAGAKAMTATSGPGFSLMQENIGFAAIAEVPCVIINVQRAGPSTGLPTQPAQADVQQTRWGTHGDHSIIALAPSSVLECFTMTVECVNLSERFRTPVVLLSDEVVGHMRESVKLPLPGTYQVEQRKRPSQDSACYSPFCSEIGQPLPPLAAFGDAHRFHVTGLTHDARGFPTMVRDEVDVKIRHIVGKIEDRADELASYEEFMLEDADVLLFAYGSTARVAKSSVRELRKLGVRAGLLRTKTIWPFSRSRLAELADRLRLVIVPEMNLGQLALEVERAVCGAVPVRALGKVDGELFVPDEITEFTLEESGR
ncbi:MAG: 2-oxoacid:acceptor oxidoreductase subunit alpha [Candidatus Eisenbacteria bacterium]|nr:2-oxoacid:acceptor oxidoreductase subunit alpha [Candidatus Eisenbacteria bacterium]